MNFKNLFRLGSLAVLLALFLVGAVDAQTFYVNNQVGDDANSGLAGSPKKTLNSALIAAPSGSTISVAYTGIDYVEGDITISDALPGEAYTFVSTGGTPVFVNAKFSVGSDAANKGIVTFNGPFQFNQGLELINGTIAGGQNLTIGNHVKRTDLGSITGHINYSGTNLPFTYDYITAAGGNYTIGAEFPTSAQTTICGNLTTTSTGGGVFTLVMNEAKTINGVLTLVNGMNLSTYQLNIVGTSAAHAIGGNVTNGTIAFSLVGGNATINGTAANKELPNITATSTGARTLTIGANISVVGDLTANGDASVTATNTGNMGNLVSNGTGNITTANSAGTIGNITVNGTGNISVANNGTVGDVLASATSKGNITLDLGAAGTSTAKSLTMSGLGKIAYGANVNNIVVNGNVLLNTAFALNNTAAMSTLGIIEFSNDPTTITGSVTNNASFSGSTDEAGNGTLGNINFLAVNQAINIGSIINSTYGTYSVTGGGTFTGTSGNITFAYAGTLLANSFTVTGSINNATQLSFAKFPTCGNIQITGAALTPATFALNSVSNTSSTTTSGATTGLIDFNVAATAPVTVATVASSGAFGGDVIFGVGNFTVTGDIQSTRTQAGADIIVGTATDAVTLTLKNVLNSGAAAISFPVTLTNGAVNVSGKVENTGAGVISFPNTVSTVLAFGSLNLTAGTIDLGNEAAAGATSNINISGAVTLIGGTLDLGCGAAGRALNLTGSAIQIGGATTNPTFTNATTADLQLNQPIPNVLQTLTVGNADPIYNGKLSVLNVANIPSPVVKFVTLTPGVSANLYVLNDVVFNTGAVLNSIELNNVRVNVGRKSTPSASPNFQNTTGYYGVNGGRVIMSGHAPQVVNNAAATAGALFGNFGVDNDGTPAGAGVPAGSLDRVITFNTPVVMAGDFYLALGDVYTKSPANVAVTNVTFNNSSVYPTIYRTEGKFVGSAADGFPTFTSFVNVTYYGSDKTTAFEVPTAKLYDLTVATTNGAKAGYGIINLGANTLVNGTFTVLANQSLFVNSYDLTLAGASAVVNGYVANTAGSGKGIHFGAATGTAITGTGIIPSVWVNADSKNNSINGPARLAEGIFGANNVWDGGDDDLLTADGNIAYAASADGASLTVIFPAVSGAAGHFTNLTTAAKGTLTLGSDLVQLGNMTLAAGTVDVQSYTWTHKGVTPAITGGARIIGAGKLAFTTGAPVMTVTAPAATIETNVDFNLPASTFTLNSVGADLTITGNVTLYTNSGNVTTVAIGGGRNLTLAGANVTLQSGSLFTAPAPGTGMLTLDVAAPNTTLTFTVPSGASSTIANLTVADNVTLAGGVLGNTLTVANMIHSGGLLTFNNADLSVAKFNRSGAGTYSGTGYLIYTGAAGDFQHSSAVAAGPMTIDNLRFTAATTLQNAVALNVVKNLDLQASVVNQVAGAGAGYIVVGDGLNIPTIYVKDNFDVTVNALQFGNPQTNYVFTGANGSVSTRVWPAGDRALNVTINKTAGQTETIGASKSIANALNLTSGIFGWDAGVAITLNSGALIYRTNNGSMNNDLDGANGVGTLVAPSVNVTYFSAVGNTGLEYSAPVVVNNLTLAANGGAGTSVNLNAARTISGNVTLNSNAVLNVNQNTTFVMPFTAPASTVVNVAAAKTATYQDALNVNSAAFTNNGTVATGNGLTITGTVGSTTEFTNNGTVNVTGAFSNAADYAGANASVLTATTAANTGSMVLGNSSVLTVTSVLSLGGFVTFPAAGADAIINVPADFGFSGVATNSKVTVNTTGAAAQSISLTNPLTVNNFNVNKTANVIVRISGNNMTVVTNLGLTKGLLRIDDPYYITLNLTTTGNIISGMGYSRTPAAQTDWAHVYGKLGVAIPAGTIGRTQWPVGSLTGDYRPAALTFTAGNATIAPTTIIVSHVDNTPAGDVNLNTGINGGTKFYDPTKVNMIRGKAPYYWLVSATNSLGASQLFDVELQGTNLKRKFETVNDLRIIRRFDGDITVNGWFLQGNAGNYSNILQANNPNPGDTIITVRNIASMGGIVSQAALFTIGVPSQAPLFTTAGTLANTAINEGSTFTFQYQAQDPDVNGNGIVYSLVNPVTNATLTSAGLLTFKPDYTQGTNDYTFTVKAAKANDLTSSTTTTAVITVNNVNQAPAFTTAGKLADQTIKNGQLLEFNYAATDADAGDALTYSLVNPPAGVAITAAGKLTWTPTFDQISTTPYVITVKVTDNGTPAQSATTVANITVKSARLKGDVTNDGIVASNDASKVLQMVVGSIATPAAASEDFYAADAKADNLIGAMDAYYILSYVNNGKYPDNTLAKETVTGDIAFGRISSKEEIVTVPVTLTGAQNVHSIKLSLDVDNNLVDLSAVNSSLPEGWMMLHNYADGKLNIVMVGLEPVSNGTVASINFALKNKEARAELAGTISLNDAPESALSKIGVKQVPAQFELSQNYPNPFNPTTTVKYSLAVDTKVTLSVYNMVGQKIRTLVDGQQESGYYSINWDGTNELGQKVASGIYIYRLETGSFISSKKMNLLK